MGRILVAFGALLALVGVASLALTAWLWFGRWPQEARGLVEHQRSVAANRGRAPDPLLAHVRGREPRSLAGTWQAVIDPYGRAAIAGVAPRDVRPQTPSDLGEFSFEGGLTLEVPGDWNSQDPRLVFYRGSVWYKTTFEHVPASGRRHFLWFGAANYRASVYLNGRLLGEHLGGFTPFNFEVSEGLRAGENLLVVRVDNDRTPEDVPTPVTDWQNFGGLTRDVLLVSVPGVFLRTWSVGLAFDGAEGVEVVAQLSGANGGELVRVAIPELGAEGMAPADAEGVARVRLDAAPERWSPENPRLYRVEIAAGDDRVEEEIGFRTLEVLGDEILLNGESIFLRGISLHEEAPGGRRAHSVEDARTLLGWARDLECNFVRLAHYPHNDHMAREADRLGLLVWAEIPVYWDVAFESEHTLELARTQLSELIERDRNRASVVVWSIGNETPMTEARLRFMIALVDHVRALDDTRLVSAALLTGAEALTPFVTRAYLPALFGLVRDEWVFPIHDPLAERVDLAAVNEYFGWYYSGAIGTLGPFSSHHTRRVMLDNMERIRFELPAGKPLVVSELGAGAVAGRHAPEEELAVYSEEYQALVYRRQLAMLERQPSLRGISPWVLKDFRSPMRMYQGVQDYWNRKGLVADDGTRKQAFGVLRDYYRQRRVADGGAS